MATFAALLLLASAVPSVDSMSSTQTPTISRHPYDLIILGGGAAGGFASGAAMSGLFSKTAVVDIDEYFGGDCTNAACVPSKALRSAGRQNLKHQQARQYVVDTVKAVRRREDPSQRQNVGPHDLILGRNCHFVDAHTLQVQPRNQSTPLLLSAKRFLICTGAAPIVPDALLATANHANVTVSTYRTLLRPEGDDAIWDMMQLNDNDASETSEKQQHLVIVGGGATACELGQSLARLAAAAHRRPDAAMEISLVAPAVLPGEDTSLQQAALDLLEEAGIRLHLGVRLQRVLPDKRLQLSDGTILPATQALLCCTGRAPTQLAALQLEKLGVAWNSQDGVLVHPRTLRSTTAGHVYAAGDCASAVSNRARTATLAAWTGFHAVLQMGLPFWLSLGLQSIHETVPRVVYMDPELACVGLTTAECIARYGINGYVTRREPELGTDKADMERGERNTNVTFVELRATKGGRLLGCTACGPAAVELANSMGLVITNKMSVLDITRSIHSYPSYGYLLHRLALSIALADTWGFLEGCTGPFGKLFGLIGRMTSDTIRRVGHCLKRNKRIHMWQEEGTRQCLCYLSQGTKWKVATYLDISIDPSMRDQVMKNASQEDMRSFLDWLDDRP